MSQRSLKEVIKNIFELGENENKTKMCLMQWEIILRGKFIALHVYFREIYLKPLI